VRNLIFISYSHKDIKWLKRLQVFLKHLERKEVIEYWDDTRIDPGGKWREQIDEAIISSSVAVLLISADFLASDFIQTNELPRLLSAAEDTGLIILPVIISPCGFERIPELSKFQAINPELKPLTKMRGWEKDQLWDEVTQAIETAISRPTTANETKVTISTSHSEDIAFTETNVEKENVKENIQDYPPKIETQLIESSQSDSGVSNNLFKYESLYNYDRAKKDAEARLLNGAVLYRMTSIIYSSRTEVLTGDGSVHGLNEGSFHRVQQRATYGSNNVLVSIAEVLYNMYRQTLGRINYEMPPQVIMAGLQSEMVLVVLRVKEISNLVYAEAEAVRALYDPRLTGTVLVQPDLASPILSKFGDQLRVSGKSGVICPSARHSRGFIIVLFRDETNKIISNSYETISIRLQLLAEEQDTKQVVNVVDPFKQTLHPTMGYYSFADAEKLNHLIGSGLINPSGIPSYGIVDFVRRNYFNYPDDAVMMPTSLQSKTESTVEAMGFDRCPLALNHCPIFKLN
jgi:hypothetical protein